MLANGVMKLIVTHTRESRENRRANRGRITPENKSKNGSKLWGQTGKYEKLDKLIRKGQFK